MLPFLKRNQEASAASPIESQQRKPDHEEEYDALESAADELMAAVKANDSKGVASALRAAFDLMESEPHEESNE